MFLYKNVKLSLIIPVIPSYLEHCKFKGRENECGRVAAPGSGPFT